MDQAKTPLPPTQKPDQQSSKTSDLPREPERRAAPEIQRASAPVADGANRARRSTEIQQSIGNARTGQVLQETFHRAPEQEQHLADVYGADDVDKEKHAAHATPSIKR
jgi:hypothetical protein